MDAIKPVFRDVASVDLLTNVFMGKPRILMKV